MHPQVVLITGAASGLGKTIAERFAKDKSIIVIIDLNLEKAEAAAHELKKHAFDALAIQMDVSSEDAVKIGIKKVVERFGRIDVLVSNAGIQIIDPIEKFTYENWKKMLAVHLDGAFLLTKECLHTMYKARCGSIIYIGSVHSKVASVLKAPYVTAKHGLEGLCRAVAKEGAKYNVKANLVCPGFVLTPLVQKQIPEQAKELGISEEDVIKKVMLKDTVDGEFTSAEDVAEVVHFFATFPTLALTGQSMVVSHGFHME
jgi:3-hydroxybutyrate dehydrogenase